MDISTDRGFYERYVSPSFAQIFLQPTTYCPANCTYCYLPGRDARNSMKLEVADAVAASILDQNADHSVNVVWHGGEPLALPVPEFIRRLESFEALRRAGRVRHTVQTNGMLINEAWCDVFLEYGFNVGISIDGPREANLNRVNWAGRPFFDHILRGIETLKKREVKFSAICVVTPETVGRPNQLLDFFDSLGASHVGFNVEEIEGQNIARPDVDESAVAGFWDAVVRHQRRGTGVRVREIQRLVDYLTLARNGKKQLWLDTPNDPGPAVSWDGRVVLMSPELMGTRAPHYDDFIVGNILDESLPSMLARAHEVKYVSEFMHGLAECETTCSFWDMCRGAQASNRYAERSHFAVTETAHCRNTRQAPIHSMAAAFDIR
ncbi:cyclophane-forming radical SAM peptide maturase AmcB [Actinoplanes sp. NPDC049596]|uniref:cyclophane-forming radical SAM peptide maturase AmcB n=1 Tax=unclassified Actinoplanes TaxID=2626549 RepID=UPI0034171CD3